jgi:two-component system OmpR family sensor kinase
MRNEFPADSAHYMQLLVDKVPAMLAYWDRDLKCRFANRAYEAWFGVDPDKLVGTHVRDLLGPELFAMNEPLMRRALAGEPQSFERVITAVGGIQRPSLTQYIPDVVDGSVQGFLVHVTNLIEVKEIRAALQSENQLRLEIEAHASKLQTLLQERTEMLDVLAHEVRQPLSNAATALQAAKSALPAAGDSTAAEQVVQAQTVLGDVLSKLDNTLAVASLLARPDPIQHDDVDIDALMAIVVADIPTAERGRIEVHRKSHIRTASMDMSLMRLALRNVLSNALKFSPPGSTVEVHVADTEEPPALLIDVIDHGDGIQPDLLDQLFMRGARGSHGKQHGLGLGLYIVDRVMTLHQGTIELLRTGAQGTTIRLALPQADPD